MKVVGRGEQGQALLEFALILPVFLMLIMGLIDFGRIYWADLVSEEVGRDAARYISLGESYSQVELAVENDAAPLGNVGWQSTNTTVSWTTSPAPSPNPPVSSSTWASGQAVTVQVTTKVGVFDPLFAAILGNPVTLTNSVTMRTE